MYYNSKRKILPKPLNEVYTMLLTVDIETHKGEPFVLSNNVSKNIIMFSCQSDIDFLCKSQTMNLDGTFSIIVRNYLLEFLLNTDIFIIIISHLYFRY